MADRTCDVVVVGGGIAGGAMATVLARSGLDVIVLERDERIVDRNKGENMMPWGAAEVAALGLGDVLDAAGGAFNPGWHFYDEAVPGGAIDVPLPGLPGVRPGTYTVAHPAARAALGDAARAAGAEVRTGVEAVSVVPGSPPEVAFRHGGVAATVRPRLVVAADGRSSAIRHDLGIALHRSARTHVVSSMGMRGVPDLDELVIVAQEDGKLMLVVPLGGDEARLYLVSATPPGRGATATAAVLDATAFRCVPDTDRWTTAAPFTSPATYGGEDTWVDDPRAPGVVLVGDAAGYNSPIIGQGLSLAMRDVREVRDVVLAGDVGQDAFASYASRRYERMRRVRFYAQFSFEICTWAPEARARVAFEERRTALLMGMFLGYDDAPAALFGDDVADDLRRLAHPETVGV